MEGQQKAVSSGSLPQSRPQLLPGQHPLVLGPKIPGNPQLAGRVLAQELLLDGLVEDRLQISSLLDATLAIAIRQVCQMCLQRELIERNPAGTREGGIGVPSSKREPRI